MKNKTLYCHLPTDGIFKKLGGNKSGGEASLIGRMEKLKSIKGEVRPE